MIEFVLGIVQNPFSHEMRVKTDLLLVPMSFMHMAYFKLKIRSIKQTLTHFCHRQEINPPQRTSSRDTLQESFILSN